MEESFKNIIIIILLFILFTLIYNTFIKLYYKKHHTNRKVSKITTHNEHIMHEHKHAGKTHTNNKLFNSTNITVPTQTIPSNNMLPIQIIPSNNMLPNNDHNTASPNDNIYKLIPNSQDNVIQSYDNVMQSNNNGVESYNNSVQSYNNGVQSQNNMLLNSQDNGHHSHNNGHHAHDNGHHSHDNGHQLHDDVKPISYLEDSNLLFAEISSHNVASISYSEVNKFFIHSSFEDIDSILEKFSI